VCARSNCGAADGDITAQHYASLFDVGKSDDACQQAQPYNTQDSHQVIFHAIISLLLISTRKNPPCGTKTEPFDSTPRTFPLPKRHKLCFFIPGLKRE